MLELANRNTSITGVRKSPRVRVSRLSEAQLQQQIKRAANSGSSRKRRLPSNQQPIAGSSSSFPAGSSSENHSENIIAEPVQEQNEQNNHSLAEPLNNIAQQAVQSNAEPLNNIAELIQDNAEPIIAAEIQADIPLFEQPQNNMANNERDAGGSGMQPISERQKSMKEV